MCLSMSCPVLQESRRDIPQPALPRREELFVSMAEQVRSSPSRHATYGRSSRDWIADGGG